MFWRKKKEENLGKAVEETATGPVEETEEQKKKRRSSWRDAGDWITNQDVVPYLRNTFKLTDDDIGTRLKQVTWDGVVEGKPVTLVRIFNPKDAAKKGINPVEDYHTLDNQPDLILYEGYWSGDRKHASYVHIEKKG